MKAKPILVVDDSAINCTQVKTFLSDLGYEVLVATSGKDALALLEKHTVSLILSDVTMPEMSGIEMVTEIRSRGIKAPIIMLTAEASADIMREGKQAGANAWMVKPFKPKALTAAVEKAVSMS